MIQTILEQLRKLTNFCRIAFFVLKIIKVLQNCTICLVCLINSCRHVLLFLVLSKMFYVFVLWFSWDFEILRGP